MPLYQEAAIGVQHNCSYMLAGCCAPVAADSTTAAAACRSDRVERFDANDAAVAAADAADAADAAPDRGPRAAHGEHSEADGGAVPCAAVGSLPLTTAYLRLAAALSQDFAKFDSKFANVRASAKFREICLLSELSLIHI